MIGSCFLFLFPIVFGDWDVFLWVHWVESTPATPVFG